jgi:general secretion pathway protein G
MLKHTKGKISFTLVELLIVISIIAILASLLFTAINAGADNAKVAATKALIKNLYTAIESYNIEYGEYPDQSLTSSIEEFEIDPSSIVDANFRKHFTLTDDIIVKNSSNNDCIGDAFGKPLVYMATPGSNPSKSVSGHGTYKMPDKDYDNLHDDFFIYSFGPNETNQNGVGSNGVDSSDDVMPEKEREIYDDIYVTM